MPAIVLIVLCACTGAASAVSAQQPEAVSLLGKLLVPHEASGDMRAALEANLASARAAHEKDPHDAGATIALGRVIAELGRYHEAIEILTMGVEAHADEPRLYRVRGELYITIRKFDVAIKDFSKAAELLEGKPDTPDGDGSFAGNVHFLLGSARYLKGEFSRARDEYQRAQASAKSTGERLRLAHWLYMTFRRMDQAGEAQKVLERATFDASATEDDPYASLLTLYRGQAKPDDVLRAKGDDAVVVQYGVANWYFYNGKLDEAKSRLKHVVEKHERRWPMLDYAAAEADYARVVKMRRKKGR
ncbi:MAG: hypothetical protein DMF86_13285 [Acidobacteria bacterium]|nr:MAG: hypothetical protein DMF86_13285 [Acidobacteriota bacterium]